MLRFVNYGALCELQVKLVYKKSQHGQVNVRTNTFSPIRVAALTAKAEMGLHAFLCDYADLQPLSFKLATAVLALDTVLSINSDTLPLLYFSAP